MSQALDRSWGRISNHKNMKPRLTFIIATLLAVLTMISFAGMWLIWRSTTPGRLGQLTIGQRYCVQQLTNNPVYIEAQTDSDSVAIGYFVDDDFYVALFSAGQSGECRTRFHEKVWRLETFGEGTSYEKKDKLSPQRIQEVRLINSQAPVVYVWFDILGVGKNSNAKHIFFAKKDDGSYQAILVLELCVGLSAVHITEQFPPTITVRNDRLCDWPPSKMQSFVEYSLWDSQPIILKAWSTGEFH